MKAILELTEKEVKFWIDIIQTQLTAKQAELNKELPDFIEHEKHYLQWKPRIDEKKEEIQDFKLQLDTLVHFDKFKDNPKPKRVDDWNEPQQQVVKKKFAAEFTPLKQIRWSTIIEPALIKLNRFIRPKELWKYLLDSKLLEDTLVNQKRYSSAASSTKNKWFVHHADGTWGGWIGLRSWDLSKHLNDFYKEDRRAV